MAAIWVEAYFAQKAFWAHSKNWSPQKPKTTEIDEFFIFFNHFAKIYDGFKILQFWQPFVVAHGGHRCPRRFQV
jgi:hypothetical protein